MSKEHYGKVRMAGKAWEEAFSLYRSNIRNYFRNIVETMGDGKRFNIEKWLADNDRDDELPQAALNEDEYMDVLSVSMGGDGDVWLHFEDEAMSLTDLETWAMTDFVMEFGELVGDDE